MAGKPRPYPAVRGWSEPNLRGYRAPRKGEICSARQTRSTKRSGAVIFSLSPFFFLLCSRAILVLYCIVTRGHYSLLLLLLTPTPPHAAAARRRRCRRRTPPSSPPPPPHAARRRRRRCRILLRLRGRGAPQLSPRSRSPTSFAFAARRRTYTPSHAPPHAAVVSAAAHSPIAPPSSIEVVAHRVDRYH